MVYKFECDCGQKEYDIPMSTYDDFKNQKCPECGKVRDRVFEACIGATLYNCPGFYDTDVRGVSGR